MQMNYKEFIQDVKNDNIKSVYFFTGEEAYIMNNVIKVLKEKYIDESLETLNYIVLDGKEINFDSVLNACETLPFMAQKKIVIIKDIGEMVENNQNDFEGKMATYFEELADYVCLVIMDRSSNFKKTGKIYRTIRKLDGIVEFPRLKGADLSNWVNKGFRENNKEISNVDLNYFIQQSTYSDYNSTKTLYDLENELKKVASHSSNRKVSKEDIDSSLARTLDTNIFNLLKSITDKDSESALRIFNEMYIANEPVQRILFMIIRQLRLILSYKLYKEKGYSESQVQEKLQVKAFEFKKISAQASGFSEGQLRKALNYILETDIKQKTSSYDEKLALEILIINLSMVI